jgi:site-specific DNA-adenine methylase
VSGIKAPFVWFGGKRKISGLVWDAFGPVDNYIEPFAGSLACLLGRPDDRWQTCAETVNDMDAYLSNFWRALSADPEQVAKYADWTVNETDLIARHLWLVNTGKERIAKMESDPDFFDAKVAGWWVWGINAWIGSGWCSGVGPWKLGKDGLITKGNAGRGVNRNRPHLSNAGRGVNRKRPHLSNAGRGVNRKRPTLNNEFSVNVGCNRMQGDDIRDYFIALAQRLRRVRVCCGDWSRIVTDGAMSYGDKVGVFLDPPYSGEVRCKNLYASDDHDIAVDVRDWAIAHGDDSRLRIVLCGYEAEHIAHMPRTWRMHLYSASRSYGTSTSTGTGEGNDTNRHEERLWFSPHCLNKTQTQGELF